MPASRRGVTCRRQRWKRDRAQRISAASPTPELDGPLDPTVGEDPAVAHWRRARRVAVFVERVSFPAGRGRFAGRGEETAGPLPIRPATTAWSRRLAPVIESCALLPLRRRSGIVGAIAIEDLKSPALVEATGTPLRPDCHDPTRHPL